MSTCQEVPCFCHAVGTVEGGGENLTVSPDGNPMLYARYVGEGADLVLIENFR